jgi:hypothetical protein
MALHAADFKGGDTEFGIFYPTGYVLAVFADVANADAAIAALLHAGFAERDLVVATGPDVLAYSGELRSDHGLFSRFERFIAGVYGDAPELADELVSKAQLGHTFVAVRATDDAATERVVQAVRGLSPAVFRKFDALTFRDLR